jgi:FtsP/CotA-like multicopper oxidase with cupredoxin domain
MTILNRRQFLAASAAVGVAGMLGAVPSRLRAAGLPATVLRAETRQIVVHGRAATVYGIRQRDDTPGLVTDIGKEFAVRLENRLAEPTLIHWHGLTPPSDQDGVPDLSQPALLPGKSYDYRFPLHRSGTYWMHSHVGLQEAQLLAAPLIIHDHVDKAADEQEVVILLHDFSFRRPEEILEGLRKGAGPIIGMDMSDNGSMSHMGSMAGMGAMAGMSHEGGMSMDLNDIDFDAYLANDRTLDDPEVVKVERGGRIRLRIINAAASTGFWIDLGELEGEVIAVDGDAIEPVRDRIFPMTMAQRLDIRLRLPDAVQSYPILARREGDGLRTGILLAPPGAAVRKMPAATDDKAPPLDLTFESRLRAARPLPMRKADRTITIDLAGNMQGYVWHLLESDQPAAPKVRAGERVEIVLQNRTMMAHPMHLHGHRFQLVAIGGTRSPGAIRDTVLVPPMKSVTIAFDADNPGRWAFHCHHLFHMMTGMMSTLTYDGVG